MMTRYTFFSWLLNFSLDINLNYLKGVVGDKAWRSSSSTPSRWYEMPDLPSDRSDRYLR